MRDNAFFVIKLYMYDFNFVIVFFFNYKVEARTRDLQETLSRQLSYMLDDFDGSVS